MTYKELALQQENYSACSGDDNRRSVKAFLDNQTPVMKAWFILMVINLGVFLILTH